jgi:transcriptional accessory protein Tex/SPT6
VRSTAIFAIPDGGTRISGDILDKQFRRGHSPAQVYLTAKQLNVQRARLQSRMNQKRAQINQKRFEPKLRKKKRLLTAFTRAEKMSKEAAYITRDVQEWERTPLSKLSADLELNGKVISLTNFGAYIDVGTEIDALLHVRDMSADEFVGHPRELLSPGDIVEGLRVKFVDGNMKKLGVTLLSTKDQIEQYPDIINAIPLDELEEGNELWGEIKKVTNYGAFIKLGCIVDGFLHFMDHPDFVVMNGQHPSMFMEKGQRVRVWASKVDITKNRLQVTGIRPSTLPQINHHKASKLGSNNQSS